MDQDQGVGVVKPPNLNAYKVSIIFVKLNCLCIFVSYKVYFLKVNILPLFSRNGKYGFIKLHYFIGFNGNGTWATAVYKCVVNGSL